MNLKPEDLGIIITLSVICLTMIIFKILNNRKTVIRNVLHGSVTYTIKGYGGMEALRIAEALERTHETETTGSMIKATAKDVRP